MSIPRTNWHSAAIDAIQITLRDHDSLLEYHREYRLSGGSHRIDLLLIHKLSDVTIPHPIAAFFQKYNLFEIKGVASSVSINAYYKSIAYATLLISEDPTVPPHFRRDISLTFVSYRFPGKLISYLTKECQKEVAKPSPGVYTVSKDIFPVQILVTKELPADPTLYLRCLTNDLRDRELIERLALDYAGHQNDPVYENYMNQLINANLSPKGESPMCCEGIFKLYGTSSKEIAENAIAPIQETLDQTTAELDKTAAELDKTAAELDKAASELDKTAAELDAVQQQNAYLKLLLDQHGIAYS